MDEKEIRDGKKIFISYLLFYREAEKSVYELYDYLQEVLEIIKDNTATIPCNINDIQTPIINKFIILEKEFNQRGMDMIFLEDRANSSLFSANFFSGVILTYHVHLLAQIAESIRELVTALKDLYATLNKYFYQHILKSFYEYYIKGNKFFTGDKKCEEQRNKVWNKCNKINDLVTDYYMFDIVKDYPKVVRYVLENTCKEPFTNDALLETFLGLFDVDSAFCKAVQNEQALLEIKEIYKSYFEKYGFDTNILERCENEVAFTAARKDLIDASSYLKMSSEELASILKKLEEQENCAKEIVPKKLHK